METELVPHHGVVLFDLPADQVLTGDGSILEPTHRTTYSIGERDRDIRSVGPQTIETVLKGHVDMTLSVR